MSDTVLPGFFDAFPMRPVAEDALDAVLREDDAPPLTLLFLWGRDCPNCDIAKRAILQSPDRFRWPEVRWLHRNVYDDAAMATRFSLHGIPVFFVFRGARLRGRITGWPGAAAFVNAVTREIAELPPGA